MKEFLSLWGFGEDWGIFVRYVGKIMDSPMDPMGEASRSSSYAVTKLPQAALVLPFGRPPLKGLKGRRKTSGKKNQ